MNISNLLNQFLGSQQSGSSHSGNQSPSSNVVSSLTSKLPGGLAGGAAVGGVMALLVGNKSARKFAGKAARYGGAAMLGGLAFSAYRNWQNQQRATVNNMPKSIPQTNSVPDAYAYQAIERSFRSDSVFTENFQLTLVQAMIAAANADGHIDNNEQQRIVNAIEQMELSNEVKGVIFDLMRQTISVQEVANGAHCIEQKSGVYLASCLAVDLDGILEQEYLGRLAAAMELPGDLAQQLQDQAERAFRTAA